MVKLFSPVERKLFKKQYKPWLLIFLSISWDDLLCIYSPFFQKSYCRFHVPNLQYNKAFIYIYIIYNTTQLSIIYTQVFEEILRFIRKYIPLGVVDL